MLVMRVGFFLRAWIATKVNHLVSKHYDIKERLRFKREFVPRDQVFPLLAVNCLLLQLKISIFTPVLYVRIVLDCSYLLIFYFEKFST